MNPAGSPPGYGTCPHLDLGLPRLQTCEKPASVVDMPPSPLGYGSLNEDAAIVPLS